MKKLTWILPVALLALAMLVLNLTLFPSFPQSPPELLLTVGGQTVTLTAQPPVVWYDGSRHRSETASISAGALDSLPVAAGDACRMNFRLAPVWIEVTRYDEEDWSEGARGTGVPCDLESFTPAAGRHVYDIEAHWVSKDRFGSAHYRVIIER